MCMSPTFGAFAEEALVHKSMVIPVPDGMKDEDAASILCAHGTAHHALKQRAKLAEGETLVVLGAAGEPTGCSANWQTNGRKSHCGLFNRRKTGVSSKMAQMRLSITPLKTSKNASRKSPKVKVPMWFTTRWAAMPLCLCQRHGSQRSVVSYWFCFRYDPQTPRQPHTR